MESGHKIMPVSTLQSKQIIFDLFTPQFSSLESKTVYIEFTGGLTHQLNRPNCAQNQH